MTDGAERAGDLVIRLAESDEDLAFMLPLSREFHAASHYGDMPYDLAARNAAARMAIDRPDRHGYIMAVHRDVPAGFLACMAGTYMTGGSAILVTVQTLYVGESFRRSLLGGRIATRMLAGAVRWAEARNAREIMIHVTTGIDVARTDRFLRKAGFATLGGNYALPLSPREGAQIVDDDDDWSGE